MKRNELKQIGISEIKSFELPDMNNSNGPKAVIISNWLTNTIKEGVKTKQFKISSLLPQKSELAELLGVSIGTIQNAIRIVEDNGFVESKQCIGTLIKDFEKNTTLRKLTSKREITIENIKKFILSNNLKTGDKLPSSRILAEKVTASANTTRLALEYLCRKNIIEKKVQYANDSGWIIQSTNFELDNKIDVQETLVNKIAEDLKNYIDKKFKVGDKLPPHDNLAKHFNVSLKTIHDAIESLTNDGILLPRRGRYGTSIIKMPFDTKFDASIETSIFAPANKTAFYYYERTQNHIKKIISENYSIGDKLPSIMEFSRLLDLSPNTIRKAFQNLASEGYLSFSRGRYGGTFVIDIPETESQTYKWLAVNPKYAEIYNNSN